MFSIATKIAGITSDVEKLLYDPKPPPTEAEKKMGSLVNRSGGHWSIYVEELGFVVGLVVAVASYVMGQYQLIAAGLTISALSGLAVYELNDMRYLKTVEEYIEILSQKVTLIGTQIGLIRQTDQHIHTDIEETEKAADKYELEAQNAEKTLSEKLLELEKVKKDLAQKETEFEEVSKKLLEVYKKVDGATNHMEEEVKGFSETHELLQGDVRKFIANVNAENIEVDKVEKEVGEIDVKSSDFAKQLTQLYQVLDKLQGLIELLKKLHQASFDEKNNISKLEATKDKIMEIAKAIQISSLEVLEAKDLEGKTADKIQKVNRDATLALSTKLSEYIQLLQQKKEKGKSDGASKK